MDEAGLANTIQEVRALVALAWQALSTFNPTAPTLAAALPASAPADPAVAAATPVIEDEAGARRAAHLLAASWGASGLRTAYASGATTPAAAAPPPATPGFLCPVLPVSCVTGKGLDCMHAFLHALEPMRSRGAPLLPGPPLTTASAPDLRQWSGSPAPNGTAASSGGDTAGTSVCTSVAASTADLTQLGTPTRAAGSVAELARAVSDSATSPTTLTAADDTCNVHFQVGTAQAATIQHVAAPVVCRTLHFLALLPTLCAALCCALRLTIHTRWLGWVRLCPACPFLA